MDFSINGLSTENRLRPQRTPIPYKIKVNNCKLIDLVIRIEITREILMPRFSNFLRRSIIHFRMFLYLESLQSLGFVDMPVKSCMKDAFFNLSLSN